MQWTTTTEDLPQPTRTPKKISKNACAFEDTIAASGVYSTTSTDLDTKINGRAQAISMNSSLESMEPVAKSVVKHLRPKNNPFTTDPRPTPSSQNVRVSSSPALINAVALSNLTLVSIPLTLKALKGNTATISKTSQRIINSSEQKEVVTINIVRTEPRPVLSSKTSQGDNMLRKVSSEVSSTGARNDQPVEKQAHKRREI